jgi:hypothetical protein
MKRHQFLLFSACLAWLFGAVMLLMPGAMSAGNVVNSSPTTMLMFRMLGGNLIAVGTINFLARRDPMSNSLRAIMIGNIILHALSYALDIFGYSKGLLSSGSLGMGGVVHVGLIVGFSWYEFRAKESTTVGARATA